MRKEERTETIVKTVYIAEDGKEFDEEYQCESYEEDLEDDRRESRFDQCKVCDCPAINNFFSSLGVYEGNDKGAAWYIFRTDEDIAIAKWYAKYAGGAKDIGEILKNTPYLIMEYSSSTKWFHEDALRQFQIEFCSPVA